MEGRVALVTGAGRGIGRVVAQRLSRQGLRVALVARHTAELDETAAGCAGPALVVPADVTDPGQVEAAYATVEQRLGTGGGAGRQRRRRALGPPRPHHRRAIGSGCWSST